MTYEIYRYIFIGGAIACGLMLAVTVILFFALKIPKVIGDLSGRTARKAIDDIRRQNEASGDKTYKSSAVNMQRGKVTDKITKSGRLEPQQETPFGTGTITQKISTQELQVSAEETSVLNAGPETSVLDAGSGETAVLGAAPVVSEEYYPQQFVIEYEITYIHTDEVIA